MEVTAIAHLASSMAAARTEQEIGVAVLKKALASQAAGALALIQTLPQPPSLPAHLGQNVNTTA